MWLAIEGVVGAGKTTTSQVVGRLTGIATVLERLDEHPFLEAYYREPTRYAVETELAFMLLQVDQLREAPLGEHLITDFAPAKNLIFARLSSGADDLRLIEAVDARLWGARPKPEMAVFLDVPLETCLARLAARGRVYERNLTSTDLSRIRAGYLDNLGDLGRSVVRIDLTGEEEPKEVAERVIRAVDLESS